MRLLWLPDVLRAAGLNVVTIDGWESRGKDLTEVRGIVWHHDAAAVGASTAGVEHLLVVGRSDLPGPLCQLALRRDGTWVVVAAGRANHNGYGTWGNESIGVEARNNGTGQPWPDAQVESYVSGTAAICRHLGLTVAAVKGHKETDPRRKIDPAGIDMDQARQRIAMRITYQPPTTPTTPEPGGPLMALTDAEQTELLTKVRELHDDYAVKGKSMRQVILETAQRTKDLVTGKRPGS
mgnify:FL=1